jgi:hypothetical protein
MELAGGACLSQGSEPVNVGFEQLGELGKWRVSRARGTLSSSNKREMLCLDRDPGSRGRQATTPWCQSCRTGCSLAWGAQMRPAGNAAV